MSSAMSGTRWRFLDADSGERSAFGDLDRVLGFADPEPTAPPNRLRRVHRVVGPDGRVYFLKRFRRVQWNNLLRNVRTAPRCGVDAAREAAVAAGLRAAGLCAPRPVALGRAGLGSALLVAELPGEPLRDRIARGDCPRTLADRVAAHCGALWALGFVLPDLSADHVFVAADPSGAWRLGVLDLHDGRFGRARARDLRRCLRRFHRSVRGLAVTRAAALRFAARLTSAAGLDRTTLRTVLAELPPWDTHARYDRGGRAGRYAARSPERTARELELLERVWPGRSGETVLDAPCGAARLRVPLEARGARWFGADRSPAMLAEARAVAGDSQRLYRADAAALPFVDRAFDGVVMFRFLHHLPDDAARRALGESARVAARFVVVSFFHPVSVHNLDRRLREWWTGRARARFSRRVRTIDAWMRDAGYQRVALAADARFVRDLWIAAFVRC